MQTRLEQPPLPLKQHVLHDIFLREALTKGLRMNFEDAVGLSLKMYLIYLPGPLASAGTVLFQRRLVDLATYRWTWTQSPHLLRNLRSRRGASPIPHHHQIDPLMETAQLTSDRLPWRMFQTARRICRKMRLIRLSYQYYHARIPSHL